MQAVEFNSTAHDNIVELPPELRAWNGRQVRVILLAEEGNAPADAGVRSFTALSLKTQGFRFNRDEANAR
ncbi:MAG: hypothetical protein PHD37_16930 [Gallionellaceae bacterium]|nr:hypothetical protein [Gallionellaceae bacterium]